MRRRRLQAARRQLKKAGQGTKTTPAADSVAPEIGRKRGWWVAIAGVGRARLAIDDHGTAVSQVLDNALLRAKATIPLEDSHFKRSSFLGAGHGQGRFDHVADSFTISGDPQNCEHADLIALRRARCYILQVESNLCCWTCTFRDICWEPVELDRLPCGL